MGKRRMRKAEYTIAIRRLNKALAELTKLVSLREDPERLIIGRMRTDEISFLRSSFVQDIIYILSVLHIRIDRS